MKRKLTILTCLMLICSFMFGQNQGPDWGTDYSVNDGSMTYSFEIKIDGVLQEHTDLEIAPYSDGKRYGDPKRLKQTPAVLGGKFIVQGSVNAVPGAEIRFKMYDYRTNEMFSELSQESFEFIHQAIHGSAKEPLTLNFVSPAVPVAEVGGQEYLTLQEAENAAKDGETIVLLEDIVLDGMVTFFNSANPRMLTLDMNNKTITMSDDWDNTTAKSAFWVCDGLTITGNGTINAAPANEAAVYAIIVGHRTAGTTDGNAGTLVIENGTFYGNDASVISVTNGIATINGGTFESPGEFDLNCIDDMYRAGKANITVKGGTFVGFNPENNAAEGAGTNFCAEGYAALPNLDGNFIVGTKPTATVNNLGSVTIPAGEYSIWNGSFDQNTEDDGDMPLSFVMQFLADQDAEDMATSPFADWYGDFVITFTGIENGSFTADGCYLAGHYGEFGWVKIPVDGMEIERDARYPVMLGVGLGQKYDYICSGVEDFKCALYLTPEILAANPNIQVNLELAIVDNSKGSDAAASALVNNTNVYEVVDYDYDAIDFMGYVARIGEIGYNTLEAAFEAVETGETILMIDNAELSTNITIPVDQTVILDLNGKKIIYNSTTQGEAMITNRGNLTINDSGNTGEIYYNYTGAADPTYGKGNYTISNVGTLTVNGGKIHIAKLSQHAKYPIDNNSTSGDAILVINGGHLYNYNTSAIRQFCNSTTNKNSVTINGGLIEGYSAIWMQNPGKKTVNGQLTINAGEIRTTAKAYVEGTSPISKVSSRIYCTIDGEGGAWDESSAVAIDGGIINENVCLNNETPASVTLNKEATYNGSIKLYDGGQFVHNGLKNVTLSKDITGHPVPENNSEYVDGWYTISSPVGTVNHTDVVGLLNGTHDLYRYNEETMIWENVKVDGNNFKTLDLGRGYIYANTANTTLSFTGDLVVEAVEQTITVTDNNLKGFNLIGNPFTHNIRKANLSGLTLAEGYYTLSNQGAWQAVNEGDVAPMQGVLVQATTAGKLTINPTSTPQRSERINNGSIVINVANAKYSDVAYVTFNDGIGLNKIEHRNAEIPMVYVPVNGENFAIATMSQDVNEIPVSFKASTMGQYTISVEAVDCEFENMYLTDRMTGEKVNLLLEDYTFVATSNDNANRFVISFATTMPESVAENFIYINNGNMIINNIEGNAVVRVLDVLGRPVAEYNVTESANISTATLSSGVYMIQMYDNNGVKVQKVVVE